MKNVYGKQDSKGANPFDYYNINGVSMSKYVKCFESNWSLSENVYNDIKDHIEDLIEHAIKHKPSTW